MPDKDDETNEITQQEVEENPELGPDPSAAKEGVLDDEDPAGFAALEIEAAEDLLAEDESEGRRRAATSTSTANTSDSARNSGAPTSSPGPSTRQGTRTRRSRGATPPRSRTSRGGASGTEGSTANRRRATSSRARTGSTQA